MKQKNIRGFICSLFIGATLLLTGCGAEANNTLQTASLSICADSTGKLYAADYADTNITPTYLPVSTSLVLEEQLYFADNAGAEGQKLYAVSIDGQAVVTELPIDFDGIIWALAAAQEEDTTAIYLAADAGNGNGFLAAYTTAGEKLWQQDFDDELKDLTQDNTIIQLVRDAEGRLYALSAKNLILFDNKGEYQGEITCPGKEFISICEGSGNVVYVTYRTDDQLPFIAKVEYSGKKLSEEEHIIGNGRLYKGQGNTLLICDSSTVYSCDLISKQVVKLFDMQDYQILSKRIQAMRQLASGEIELVSWELLNRDKEVELIRLREIQEGEAQASTKQTITFLCPIMCGEYYAEMVNEFNKLHQEYEVVLEEIVPIKERLNTRLVAKESADIIQMIDYKEMQTYQSKGFLEELTPYLEQSSVIKEEDYKEELIECLKVDGKLYAMPKGFVVDTLGGRASELDTETGWTVEEFLDWLRKNPNAKSEQGLEKNTILEYCLKGSLDTYIDWEQGKALFQEEEFQKLLQEIRELETDENSYYDNWSQILEQGEAVLMQFLVSGFWLGGNTDEIKYQDELVYVGYPTADGEPCHFLDMNCICILSRSACKEGAYAFLEYMYLSDRAEGWNYSPHKETFDANMKYTLEDTIWINEGLPDEKEISVVTEKQVEKQLEIIKQAVPDTYANQTIRSIILEDAQAYFEGAKTLEETCNIIQNRVQLYIDENQIH